MGKPNPVRTGAKKQTAAEGKRVLRELNKILAEMNDTRKVVKKMLRILRTQPTRKTPPTA